MPNTGLHTPSGRLNAAGAEHGYGYARRYNFSPFFTGTISPLFYGGRKRLILFMFRSYQIKVQDDDILADRPFDFFFDQISESQNNKTFSSIFLFLFYASPI